jgi:hemolysin III
MPVALGAPAWRGRLHLWAFVVAVPATVALVILARGAMAIVSAAVFGAGLVLVFGTSATYHRLVRSPVARRRWRRVDHAMIYVLIAATYVPVCVLVLPRRLGVPLLVVVVAGAAAGVVLKLAFFQRAGRWPAILYLVLGWGGAVVTPQLVSRLGVASFAFLVAGGLAYTVGAAVFGRRRPDPAPLTFGYHEIWHGCTVLAAVCHFAMVTLVLAS